MKNTKKIYNNNVLTLALICEEIESDEKLIQKIKKQLYNNYNNNKEYITTKLKNCGELYTYFNNIIIDKYKQIQILPFTKYLLDDIINEINNYKINETNVYDFLLKINKNHKSIKILINLLDVYDNEYTLQHILILYVRIYAKLYIHIILLNIVDDKKFSINMTASYLLYYENYNCIENKIS